MVNTGRPSPACALCRQRKIKCDQVRPACTQCNRLRVECPGYRSALDLRFKDDGKAAAARVVRASTDAQKVSSAVALQSRPTTINVPQAAFGAKPTPIRALDTHFEDLAGPFFLSYFFSDGGGGVGSMVVPSISKAMCTVTVNDAMSAAIKAVGSATLANMRGSRTQLAKARKTYGLAVQLTRTTIREGTVSRPFELMLTVLLLSYFEIVTCAGIDNLTAWNAHLTGLVALLNTYGNSVLKDCTGQNLFNQVRSQIIANCLQRALPVPDTVTRWSERVRLQISAARDECICADLSDLQTELCAIRSQVVDTTTLNDPQRVEALYSLDTKLQAWEDCLPTAWRYEAKRRVPDCDYQSYEYHAYRDLRTAAIWNEYRTARLMVLDSLLTHVDYLLTMGETSNHIGTLLEQQAILKQKIRILCFGICASMPRLLGRTEDGATRAHAGGISVIWTLFVFGCQRCISQQQKLWAAKQLDYIGHEMGVLQALQLAKLVRAGADVQLENDDGNPTEWYPLWRQSAYPQLWYTDMKLKLPGYNKADIRPRSAAAGPQRSADVGSSGCGGSEDSDCNAFTP